MLRRASNKSTEKPPERLSDAFIDDFQCIYYNIYLTDVPCLLITLSKHLPTEFPWLPQVIYSANIFHKYNTPIVFS